MYVCVKLLLHHVDILQLRLYMDMEPAALEWQTCPSKYQELPSFGFNDAP